MSATLITAQASQAGDLLVLLRAITPLTNAANVGPMHIATEGKWEGHSQGPFEFTAEVFDEMIEQFEAQANPLVVDYEHRTFHATNPDSTAAGWIQKLEKRQGPKGWELWATVEWTDPAAKKIRARELAFCSPAFKFAGTERKSGAEHRAKLRNVALTNDPFLDGNQPIQLSWLAAAAPPPPKDDKEAPPASDKPAPEADPNAPPPEQSPEAAQAQMLNEKITAFVDQVCSTSGLDRVAAAELLSVMADEIGGLMRERAEKDGSPAEERKMSATEDKSAPSAEERIKQIEANAEKNQSEIVLARMEEMAGELKTLKAKDEAREAREKADKDAAVKTRIDGMIRCGALLETERDDATFLLTDHPTRFESIYGKRKGLGKAVPIGETQAGHETVRASAVVDPEKGTESDLRKIDRPYFDGLIACRVPRAEALKRTFEARADIDRDAIKFGLEVQ